ncbi:MAG: cbb3-type cytochrome c oxidase subunit 3 [Asticcacaulis sp.]|nr:cbb3-type cytochrome c oxidase subunit 3 [Asticcacaulis sp.]
MNTTPIGIAVLVMFTLAFSAICVWALWPGNRQRLKAHGLIPLREDKDNG